MFKTTALEIWSEETKHRSIITLCKNLDRCLATGIPLAIITELCGPPGSGKTQMCMQLCVNVQIPHQIGGVGGKAIYIDTNQGFNPTRIKDMALSCSERCQKVYQCGTSTMHIPTFSSDHVLDNLIYFYTDDDSELIKLINDLKIRLGEMENVKLIVIDSFSFVFRSYDSYTTRISITYQLLTDLQILAEKYKLAVVITNEITTRILENDVQHLCPALGDSHGHKVGQRLILGKKDSSATHHIAFLEKSLYSPSYSIPFEITKNGIRGLKR